MKTIVTIGKKPGALPGAARHDRTVRKCGEIEEANHGTVLHCTLGDYSALQKKRRCSKRHEVTQEEQGLWRGEDCRGEEERNITD